MTLSFFVQRLRLGCLLLACCFLCHCGGKMPIAPSESVPENEASRRLQTIASVNEKLSTIKAIGRIRILQDHKLQGFQATWIGKLPDQIRLEILDITGKPMISFSSDGKRHYLLSYADEKLYRTKASEKSLKRYLPLPMRADEILDLMCGRLPVHGGGAARLEKVSGSTASVLVLDDPKCDYIDRIPVTDSTSYPEMARWDRHGRLLFTVRLDKIRSVDGMDVPELITISDLNGILFQATVRKFELNKDVSDDKFVLKLSQE